MCDDRVHTKRLARTPNDADTSHTEQIAHLHVLGTNLWSAGTYTLNCYASKNNAIAEKYFFVSDDKINDMIVLHGSDSTNVILACNDATIKVGFDKRGVVTVSHADSRGP